MSEERHEGYSPAVLRLQGIIDVQRTMIDERNTALNYIHAWLLTHKNQERHFCPEEFYEDLCGKYPSLFRSVTW